MHLAFHLHSAIKLVLGFMTQLMVNLFVWRSVYKPTLTCSWQSSGKHAAHLVLLCWFGPPVDYFTRENPNLPELPPNFNSDLAKLASVSPAKYPDSKGSWGHHGVHLGPTGPRWGPCWPYELFYLGSLLFVCSGTNTFCQLLIQIINSTEIFYESALFRVMAWCPMLTLTCDLILHH